MGGDFTGDIATRRNSPFQTLVLSAFSGLVVLVAAALVLKEGFPSLTGIAWAMLAGVCGSVGIAALYRALSTEWAAGVAPTAGVIGAILPVIYSSIVDGLPAAHKLAGFTLALAGIWLVAGGNGSGQPVSRQGFMLASLAGVGFGAFFIFIDLVDRGKILPPLIVARCFTLLSGLIFVWATRLRLPSLGSNPPALLAGLLDSGGNLFFILAKQYTRLDIAAVLSSLYPASTVILAAVLLKEKITRRQGLGVLVFLMAIALISI